MLCSAFLAHGIEAVPVDLHVLANKTRGLPYSAELMGVFMALAESYKKHNHSLLHEEAWAAAMKEVINW